MLSFLAEIEREQFQEGSYAEDAASLVLSGRLEIAYYPPGFITPEEFFHRVGVSIARHRAAADADALLLVVFNSLNLLHSHFPLCAEHKVFIPAVVELLGHQGVTSFFVTAKGGTADEYGLFFAGGPDSRIQASNNEKAVLLRAHFTFYRRYALFNQFR